MNRSRPKHISTEISEAEDEWHVERCMPFWSRSLCEAGQPLDYLFGTEQITLARLLIMDEEPPHLIEINEKYPSLDYDGLDVLDPTEGMRLVHEWWYVCFQIIAASFDISQHPETDIQEGIECYSRTVLLAEREEERLRKAGKIIQKAITKRD